MSKIIAILGIVILVLGGFYLFNRLRFLQPLPISINSFEECAKAGNPIMESYPPRCNANGKTFTQDIGNELEKINLIVVDHPRPNETIKSPLEITGKARGYWYFEASFPIFLYDENNNLIGEAVAQAQEELMTEDFVPFSVNLEFEGPKTDKGWLILEKDNPSGLPENDDELKIPVNF